MSAGTGNNRHTVNNATVHLQVSHCWGFKGFQLHWKYAAVNTEGSFSKQFYNDNTVGS